MGANCTASVSIGCLFCCQGCNAEKLRVAFTFLPPQPSYSVKQGSGKNGDNQARIAYIAEALLNYNFYRQAAENAEVSFVQTARGSRCPLVWMRSSNTSQARNEQPLVLLHCHGNATDIGMMMGPYFELSKQLGIEVVGVEYSGYGVATGMPGYMNTYADVEAAYDHIIAQGVPAERIVAYGQSVGSGPVTYLASKHALGGLVLHSPLLSGIKVIDPQPDRCCRPSCVYHCLDFYPTDQRVRKASCPVFVIHGQNDDIVPFYHGVRLSEMTPTRHRWPAYFPAGAGHNDIVDTNAAAYFQEIGNFLSSVAQRTPGASSIGPPVQVEMQDMKDTAACVLGVREDDRLDANKPSPLSPSSSDGSFALSYPEPAVGPEDGMYSTLRREKAPDARPLGGSSL